MTSPSSSSFEARVDALYALPLDEFVAGRKRLADELKREGATAEAKSFLGLTKPTLSAWLTNQIVRRVPDLIRELLATTDAVAVAQRKQPESDGARSHFAAAVAAQRRAVAELAGRARSIAEELGLGASAAEALGRVENNFRWGAIPGPDRDTLSRGRLVRDVAAPGFGGFGDASAADELALSSPRSEANHRTSNSSAASSAHETAPDTAPVGRSHPKEEAHRDAESARAQARAAAEAEREHRRLVARHEAALREAQTETVRARRELARAERDRAAADERVAAAEAELASAREERDAAEEHRRTAAETLAAHEAAEATLRRSGPPVPASPGGPFRVISGH